MHYSTSSKSIILVFGGYRFRIHSVAASDELYSFDLTSKKWSILQPMPSNEVRLVKSKLLCLLCEKKILEKKIIETEDECSYKFGLVCMQFLFRHILFVCSLVFFTEYFRLLKVLS